MCPHFVRGAVSSKVIRKLFRLREEIARRATLHRARPDLAGLTQATGERTLLCVTDCLVGLMDGRERREWRDDLKKQERLRGCVRFATERELSRNLSHSNTSACTRIGKGERSAMNIVSIIEKANALTEKITELRRRFHARPELPWLEAETSLFVEQYLRKLGLENIRRGFDGTQSGVMADLKGGKPGRCVALRADLDALPLEEENDVPYKSIHSGVMHACGHDAHAAILLGVAEILSSMRDELCGTVRFLFQPAEEAGMYSGAPRMIEEGALDGVEAIGGLHVWALLESGKLGYRIGSVMASADVWDLKIQGKGGPGALPHQAVDPTVAAATVVSTLQTVVSREIDPQETVVLSIGKLEAGTVANIIPDTARVVGNVRTTNPEIRARMQDIMKRVADGICAAMRCTANLVYTPIYPVTMNDPVTTKLMRSVAVDVFGAENIVELPVVMESEDFSYYGEKVPAAYVFLGIADEAKGTDNKHHSPKFNVDEEPLPKGAALLAGFAAKFTAGESAS